MATDRSFHASILAGFQGSHLIYKDGSRSLKDGVSGLLALLGEVHDTAAEAGAEVVHGEETLRKLGMGEVDRPHLTVCL